MRPTDTSNPEYFHKVVDCQYACPAHTNVPEYIRMIAQGQFTDAYMLNRESNIFPGILGRVCDRPCEPACRRGRIEDKPVAICRLKRVASDNRDDVSALLPKGGPDNGKKIALIGAGCASLAVANDLAPLGYQCTIFEKLDVTGGLMRSNIPSFRLPVNVLDEEIQMILDMGVELKANHPIESMTKLLEQDFDAVFVGSGAPRGKELILPGRKEAGNNIYIGIDWLESVAFKHTEAIGKNVLIIGVGNTAMDCCRTSLRIGSDNVKVMARKPREFFKASAWELDDAEEENIEIIVNHSPKAFVHDNGKLTGMLFELMEYDIDDNGRITDQRVTGEVTLPCDDVILAIGQDNAFPWIEQDIGIEFDKWDVPVVDEKTFESTRKGVFFGGDAAFGPKNIIWAVEHGHQAAISIDKYCQGEDIADRLPDGQTLSSTKMGIHEWSFSNSFDGSERTMVPHVSLKERFRKLNIEVELGFSPELAAEEVERCLNCDVQTVFTTDLCIECDACIDVCPVDCLTITENGDEADLRSRLLVPAENLTQDLYVSAALPQTGRVMVKDEDVCIHCSLCAERCPTAAWDMQQFTLQHPHVEDEVAKPPVQEVA